MSTILDKRGGALSEIDPNEVTPETTEIYLSNNNFMTLPADIFKKKLRVWKVDLSNNLLSDLSFLKCFGALEYLDLRNNNLQFDELLDIAHMYVAHLRIDNNQFTVHTNSYPLTLPAILERAWIIDGQFISDFIRKQAKEFRETLAFGETVLACRRVKISMSQQTGVSQAAMTFLAGDNFNIHAPGEFISSDGVPFQSNNNLPQINRLRHLCKLYPPQLDPGTFKQYFGLALGILALEWMGEPLDTIPRMIDATYWACNAEKIESLEPFERILLLLKICETAVPETRAEEGLWSCLNAVKFIQTGEIPMHGSTPRLTISAFLERAPEVNDSVDRAFYQKLRHHCGFTNTELDPDLLEVYREIIGPPSYEYTVDERKIPKKGDTVALRHPVTDKWVNAICIKIKNYRVVTKVDGEIVQIPVTAVYWDGRGTWREAQPRSDNRNRTQRAKTQLSRAFVTMSKTQEEDDMAQTQPDPLKQQFPTMREPHASNPVSVLMSSMKRMNSTKFIDRTMKPVETFRGIGDPVRPQQKVIQRTAPMRKPNQYVQDVVNITHGPDMGYGKKLRKFNVRVENVLTHKSQYLWINENEVSPEDVQRLMDLYRKHIESKMTIIRGI